MTDNVERIIEGLEMQSLAYRNEAVRLMTEIDELKARPPMGCFSCEGHNDKLVQEVEALREFGAREERENLAWNAFLMGAGVELDQLLTLDTAEKKEQMDKLRERFLEWWDGCSPFIEKETRLVKLTNFERIALSSISDRTEDVFLRSLIRRITDIHSPGKAGL